MRWYDKDGQFIEEVLGKNGKMRKPTVRDARTNGYIPSVTTVLGLMAKPALNVYFVKEALKAAIRNPWALNKPEDQAITILRGISEEEGDKARNFGKNIHSHIERFLKSEGGEIIEIDHNVADFVQPVFEYLIENDIRGLSEEALIINVDGLKVAGTCDNMGDDVTRDFKTQKTKDGKFTCYDSWIWQIGGYNLAAQKERGEIIAISSTEPNVIKTFEFTEEEMDKGAEVFKMLVKLFYMTKNLV